MFAVVNEFRVVVLSFLNINNENTLSAIAPLEAAWDISEFNPLLVQAGVNATWHAVENSG